MMGTVDAKGELRRVMKQRLGSLPAAEKQRLALDSVSATAEYADARVVAVFISHYNEVDTRSLITAAYLAGKTVLIPAWQGDSMYMIEQSEGQYHGLLGTLPSQFRERYGHAIPMPEPAPEADYTGPIDLVVAPGLAFDPTSFLRLGYGMGHYDRYLHRSRGMVRAVMGVCYDCQLAGFAFGRDPWDVPVDLIATPSTVLRPE